MAQQARNKQIGILVIGVSLTIALSILAVFAYRRLTLTAVGLSLPHSWWPTIAFAVAWLRVMLAYSPLADWLASRWIAAPPTLEAFRAIQQSPSKLIVGIVVAWLLGAGLEEFVFRGIVLNAVALLLKPWLIVPLATGVAVCTAALGAGLLHCYQGQRAMVIITQLSVLFGVLYVISGGNLWAVMLCHGLYDTIAFIRFAGKKSKYARLD